MGIQETTLARSRPIHMKRLAILLLGVTPLVAAQEPPPADMLLDRLYAYADQYRAMLPSFECSESILSQQTSHQGYRRGGKAGRPMRVEGVMREIRKTPADLDDPFTERHQFTKVNGQPVRGELALPYFILGGFANLIGFHQSEERDCFSFRSSPMPDDRKVRLQIDRKDSVSNASCKGIFAGTHYVVVADTEGHILHSERTIPAETSERQDEAYFAAIDYAPQPFGERTFWLPTKFSSHDAAGTGRMEAVYSNCHRYTGDMKILSDMLEVKPDAKP
jgi:hypothetical protein